MSGAWIEEATAENFAERVLARSQQTTVVVDFWAAWCQPCRLLKPLLERLAEEFAGQFTLVKMDVDQAPEQAGSFGVNSIPAVFAVRGGQVVDSFAGLLSESQLRDWLQSVLPSEAEKQTQAAAACEADDLAQAETLYRQARLLDARFAPAAIGLARVLTTGKRWEEAARLLDELAARGYLEPEAQKLQALVHLHHAAEQGAAGLAELRKAAAESPHDLAAQCALAEALLAAGRYEEGLTTSLSVVENDWGKLRERARTSMLDAFRVLGDESPLTRQFRRQLSLALN